MSSGKKVAISLFITILIFSFFAVVSFTELFSTFETRFYQPAVISGIERHLKDVSLCLDEYSINQAKYFSHYVNLSCVKSASSYMQSEEDIKDREYYGKGIVEKYSGLQGIRIVDTKGKTIFFSTFPTDKKFYTELNELPYETVKSNDGIENKSKARIIFDNSRERIIYSIPFYDNYDLYRGSALFYVSGTDFNNYLISKNILSISEKAKLVATVFSDSTEQSKGFVLGLPSVSSDAILGKIVDLWTKDCFLTQKILHSEDYNWFVASDNSGKTGIISLVFKDDILIFRDELKFLLLLCSFVTLYLLVLFIFNFKQDDESVIRDKIKRFKIALINEYLDNSNEVNWDEVSRFLAIRKHQINHDIKVYLGKKGEVHKILVENLLEKTWNEVEQVIIYHEKQEEIRRVENSVEENHEQLEELEFIPEVVDDAEEVEYVDNSDRSNNEWDDDDFEKNKESEDVQNYQDASVLTHKFNKDNTASVEDFNFEFSRPDFAELDDELEEEFNKIDEEIDDVEELEELAEELEEVSEVEELEENEEVEEMEILEEVESVSEVEEKIETLDEFEEVSDEVVNEQETEEIIEELEEISEIEENEEIVEISEEIHDELVELEQVEEHFDDISEEEVIEEENFEVTEEISEVDELEEVESSHMLNQVQHEEVDALEQVESDEVTEIEQVDEIESLIDTIEEDVEETKINAIDETPEAELEELNYVEIFSLTSGFNSKIFTSEKIEELYPVDEENPIIETESGLFVISNNIDIKKLSLDQNFQNLVDSVLQNTI